MKRLTQEKIKAIEDKIELINSIYLKPMKAKLSFANRGANNYCLCFVFRKKQLISFPFYTYDDVYNTLALIDYMFVRYTYEKKGVKK